MGGYTTKKKLIAATRSGMVKDKSPKNKNLWYWKIGKAKLPQYPFRDCKGRWGWVHASPNEVKRLKEGKQPLGT